MIRLKDINSKSNERLNRLESRLNCYQGFPNFELDAAGHKIEVGGARSSTTKDQ